ncbi:porin [Caballeronia sp. DA-9]|uniref:porin n=1 Tax=Caballeronia sp. DA-9 TaxID=3436237 RepID=UPI003F6624BD
MKKSQAGCLLLLCLSGAAHSQSSMTIYGIVDEGFTYVNNSATSTGHSATFKLADSVASASRFGFRGVEDLGGGLKAIFTLENGFSVGTGIAAQGGALFGRQAFVGLSREDVGQLTFGRQYAFAYDYLGHHYATGGQTAAAGFAWHINTLDQLNGGELNNSIKFSSADFRGFTFGAMYGFSNQAGAFAGSPATASVGGSQRAYSFGANYESGPFSAGFAYSDYTYPTAATPAMAVSMANVTLNPKGTRDLRTLGVGSKYRFVKTAVYALWTNTALQAITGPTSTVNIYEGGFIQTFRPDLFGAIGFTHTKLDGGAQGKWNQVNSSLDYYLSKSTDVYILAVYQKASGANNGVPVQAQLGNNTSYVGISGKGAADQLAFRVGLRHFF